MSAMAAVLAAARAASTSACVLASKVPLIVRASLNRLGTKFNRAMIRLAGIGLTPFCGSDGGRAGTSAVVCCNGDKLCDESGCGCDVGLGAGVVIALISGCSCVQSIASLSQVRCSNGASVCSQLTSVPKSVQSESNGV